MLGGLAVIAGLAWRTLSGADLALLFGSWAIPAVAALHFLEQVGCGYAWYRVVEPPRRSRWVFVRARWVRACVAALVPVTGVGAAIVAVRLVMQAGIRMDVAGASLALDATVEMITQVIFTVFGVGLIIASAPDPRNLTLIAAGLGFAVLAVAGFIVAQRAGALRIVDAGFFRLARHWPRLSQLSEVRLHDQLMRHYRQRRAAFVSGGFHLCCWSLGAGEVWLTLAALGRPASLSQCVIVESLGMAARSAGFFVPGALGVQEVALVIAGNLAGLSPETAILIAMVKRLRDVAVGVPGLLVWQWAEGRRLQIKWLMREIVDAPPQAAGTTPAPGRQVPRSN